MKGLAMMAMKSKMGSKPKADDSKEEKAEGETGMDEGGMSGETLAASLGLSGSKKRAFLSALKDYISECAE